MKAIDYYNKRLSEDNAIGTIQLMEEYAKEFAKFNIPSLFHPNNVNTIVNEAYRKFTNQ